MKVGLDVSPHDEVTRRGELEAPADLHVIGALHVFDDDGAVRVYAVRNGEVWLVGKASLRDGAIWTRVGDCEWRRVEKALNVSVHGDRHDRAPERVPGTNEFVTFDVDRDGVPSRIVEEREIELRTHEQGNVQVCVVGSRVTVYANGACLGRAGRDGTKLVPTEAGYVAWPRIERALIAAGVGRAKRASTGRSPWTPRKTKFAALVGALYGFLLAALVVATVRGGAGLSWWILLSLGVIAVAPLLLAWGIWILSSPEALSEPTTRDPHTHAKVNGPIASKGLLLTMLGAFVYILAAIGFGFPAFGPSEASPIVHHRPPPAPTPTPSTPPTPPAPTPTPSTPAPTPTAPPEPTSLVAAIAAASEQAGRTEVDIAPAIVRYAAAHLVLDDVKLATPETTLPRALKDVARERGKRACATGVIGDIVRTTVDERDVYTGLVTTTDGDGVTFFAVGSTGELVKRNTATFCGVVTGTKDRTAVMVGMFDLPENVRPAVER